MTALTQGAWQRLCAADDVWEGELSFHRPAGGTAVILVNVDGTVRAFQGTCPHQETSLEDADLFQGVLTCSAHLWEFDARTGGGLNPATACLAQYPTEIRDGELYVQVPHRKADPQ